MGGRGHVPQRTCAGCRRQFPKPVLMRFFVRREDGIPCVFLDPSGAGEGRGAYVCRNPGCFDAAVGKSRSLQRRLGTGVLSRGLRRDFIEAIGGAR